MNLIFREELILRVSELEKENQRLIKEMDKALRDKQYCLLELEQLKSGLTHSLNEQVSESDKPVWMFRGGYGKERREMGNNDYRDCACDWGNFNYDCAQRSLLRWQVCSTRKLLPLSGDVLHGGVPNSFAVNSIIAKTDLNPEWFQSELIWFIKGFCTFAVQPAKALIHRSSGQVRLECHWFWVD